MLHNEELWTEISRHSGVERGKFNNIVHTLGQVSPLEWYSLEDRRRAKYIF